jgi:3-hydroxybutyryl-CoA dehydratase
MLTEFRQGNTLASLVRQVTQARIDLYAKASGDYNPIHVDPAFAATTPFGGTIAHGMLILAYVSEMMALNFGQDWLKGGRLSARFKESARPRDTVTVSGTIDSVEEHDGVPYATCHFRCSNQKDETIITGETRARLPVVEA